MAQQRVKKSDLVGLTVKTFLLLFAALFLGTASVRVSGVEIGEPAPDFILPALANVTARSDLVNDKTGSAYPLLRLQEYRGSFLYLDFWASYCVPCRESFPLLDRLRNQFDRSDFEVISVSNDLNPKDALRFIEDFPISFPVLSDPTGRLAQLYGVEVLPKGFLIDSTGVVRLVHEGFQTGDIRDILAPVLEQYSRRDIVEQKK